MRSFIVLLFVAALALQGCAPAPAAPTAAPTTPAAAAAPTATAAPASATKPAEPTKPAAAAAAKPAVASLRIAVLADESTLQPYAYQTGYPGWNMLMLVYDTVMQLDAENVPKPLLAQEVAVSPDGASYDVKVRSGVKWHDGKALTADDVKFTYEYFLKNTHSRFTGPLRDIDSITAKGTDGLTIKLKAPNPSFPVRALADVPIMPRHVWEPVEAAKTKEFRTLVGSGPYKLVEAVPDQVYRMQANPDYFLGAPPVGELIFPVIKEMNTALQALRSGEVQALTREIPPEQVQQFSQAPLKVAKGPGFASTMLQFNVERAPFDKREVRQAIDLAIDKQKLVDTLLLGNGTVGAPGFIHPSSPAHDPSVAPRFDPARAKQLLDQIGAAPGPDGVRVLAGKPLAATLLVQSNNPIRIRAAELIAGQLKEVGIQVTVKALDQAAVTDLVWKEFDVSKPRDYEMTMWGWSAPLQVDPGRIVDLVHSDPKLGTTNIGGYKNPASDAAGNELRTAVDEAKRKQLVQTVEKTIATDLPFVMLYFQDGNYAYRAQAYDGWVYQKGQGIFTKLSFVPGFGR